MGKGNFSYEFKRDAVAQTTERGYPVAEVSQRLGVSAHSLYAWLKAPLSKPTQEDQRQTALLTEAWIESGKVYGHRKLHDDLIEQGESICVNLVARLIKLAGIKAQIGYKRRPGKYGGRLSVFVDNTLDRQFDVEAPDKVWVTDITYIRTQEGFAYLAVVTDLFSRRVVGWSMQSRQTTDVVLQALHMAVWRRKPKTKVLIHLDQGSKFTSGAWIDLLTDAKIKISMDGRGAWRDDRMIERLWRPLKYECVYLNAFETGSEMRAGIGKWLSYYSSERRHSTHGFLTPDEAYASKNEPMRIAA